MTRKRRQRMRWILLVYLILLVVLVIFKFNGSFQDLIDRAAQVKANREIGYMNFNIKPLTTIRLYWRQLPQSFAVKNLTGNILAFLPLGFLLPQAFRICRNFLPVCFASLLFLLTCEILQLVTLLGSFDVDDIILNLFGVMLGYILWNMLPRRYGGRRRHRKRAAARKAVSQEDEKYSGQGEKELNFEPKEEPDRAKVS